MQRIWLAWLGVASLLTILYLAVPGSGTVSIFGYHGVAVASVIGLVTGTRLNRGRPRGPWLWFAAGLSSFLAADAARHLHEATGAAGWLFPWMADPLHLLMYPLLILGLTRLVRSGRRSGSTGYAATAIDAAAVAIAMASALWVVSVGAVVESGTSDAGDLVTGLAYPVMNVALVAVAARLAIGLDLRHPPFALVMVAIACFAVADIGRGIAGDERLVEAATMIDGLWLAGFAVLAAAALHPCVGSPVPAPELGDRLTARQLAIMFVAALAVPLVGLLWGDGSNRAVTIAASAVLLVLILVRVLGLVKAIQRSQERLVHDARHDALTGLSNRALFSERTAAALEHADDGVAVLFIDLDDFKNVNESLGHAAGDVLLAEVAERLKGCVGDGDTVARFGGDEFAVLLENTAGRQSAVDVARQTLLTLTDPIDLGTRSVHASASVGIAVSDGTTSDVESLLRNADVAMYLSKSRGKGRFELFEKTMHDEAIERLDLKADLQQAIEENQFVLYYQPIFDLRTGKAVLAEALIRWQHPTRGLVMPDRFIGLAEESGLIIPIGQWVMEEACAQAASWHDLDGCSDLGVTVNLSMRQLQDRHLISHLTGALEASGLPPSKLVIEITESMLAMDPERSAEILRQFRTIGVKLALDDFGTGYSSLSYLRSFPVDSIKIDRSFISELNRSSTSTTLISAVVNLSKALGAYTVAEGIEHGDQATLLHELGCDRGQGFYYCRPLPPAALAALLTEHAGEQPRPLEAWRRSSEQVQRRAYEVEIRRGLAAIDAVCDSIEALRVELGLPVMASWPWLRSWAQAFRAWSPLMVDLRSMETGDLAGYALLAFSERAEGTTVVALGHGSSRHGCLPATDPAAASALARAVASTVQAMRGVWSLDLEQLPDGDPTLHQLAHELSDAQLLPERRVPGVTFSTAVHLDDVLGTGMRRQLRRARARIAADGMEMSIAFDRGQAISLELVDEVEAVHVSRDRDTRRQSDLDRPSDREFWRQVVEATSGDWEVEIASLRLDGRLAAYVVALLDGDTYRVYDGRMCTELGPYSPGHLITAAALDRAMKDRRFAVLDWMTGVASEKLLMTNIAQRRVRLVATSASRHFSPRPPGASREPEAQPA